MERGNLWRSFGRARSLRVSNVFSKHLLIGWCLLASATAFADVRAELPRENAPLSTAPQNLQNLRSQEIATPPATELEITDGYIEAIPLQTVPRRSESITLQHPTERASMQEKLSDQMQGARLMSSITPLCPTLSINTLYTLTGTTTGGSYCYHFQVTQRAKTQVFLIGQNANTDFALTLIRHEEDDTLTVLGTSDQTGNTDESLLALTQPGHYYWLMTANASDGSAFQFGALVNTAADAHELNDVPGLATVIPNDRTPMIGNMDSAQDVDYFQFVAQHGQDVFVRMDDTFGLGEWQLEYFTGTFWAPLNANVDYRFSDLPTPATLTLRILPNPSVALNTAHTYKLVVGSFVRSSDQVNVGTTENLARISLSDTNPPLVTQVHNELNWSIRVLDSKGNPVQGVQVDFIWGTNDIPTQVHSALSNAAGIASGTVNPPDCTGDFTIFHTSGGQNWKTEFDVGAWSIAVPHTLPGEVGVGGENEPAVTLGHICRQTLQ